MVSSDAKLEKVRQEYQKRSKSELAKIQKQKEVAEEIVKKQEIANKAAKRHREKTEALLDSIMYGIQEDKSQSLANFVEDGESGQPVYEFGNSENFKKDLLDRE